MNLCDDTSAEQGFVPCLQQVEFGQISQLVCGKDRDSFLSSLASLGCFALQSASAGLGGPAAPVFPWKLGAGMLGTFISPLLWVRDHWVRGGGRGGGKGESRARAPQGGMRPLPSGYSTEDGEQHQ